MIDYCPFCGLELKKEICCQDRKTKSNMVDTSIFIEAFDESPISGDCKLILDGAKEKLYLGHVSTIILGEIMKKLLKLKREADYRYDSIYEGVMKYLMFFRILYICEGTIDNYTKGLRDEPDSQDKINLACARYNEINMFIVKDTKFVPRKTKPTAVVQITNKKSNEKLKSILNKISDKLGIS